MNRWNVYTAMKSVWIATNGVRVVTVLELLTIFPGIEDNELQEGIVEFRLMATRCHKEYGFERNISDVAM